MSRTKNPLLLALDGDTGGVKRVRQLQIAYRVLLF
jgi:hypothetical protein